jgi:hypothetical protein
VTLLDSLRDVADALTEPHIHSEPIRTWDRNRNLKIRMFKTVQPGLLAQLYQSVIPAGSTGEPPAGGVPGSRPPLAVEALSRHDEVSMAVLAWCRQLALPTRVSVESNIRALIGAYAHLDDDDQRELLRQMRQWQRWCSVLTGWESLYRPAAVPCPIIACGKTNTLRINLTAKTGMCQSCGAAWSDEDGSIGVLGDYIRSMTDPERVKATLP